MSSIGVQKLIQGLRDNPAIWAQPAPCGHAYPLAKSWLFYGDEVPPQVQPFINKLTAELGGFRGEVEKIRKRLTSDEFVKKSVSIQLGKMIEKIAPRLPGFPFAPQDCRPMFDPIDYIAFRGMSKGAVDQVRFLDVKSGDSNLSTIQRKIRDAVEDRAVSLQRLEQ
jgi:Endonuclease related to archaeal Holliday junction resolvase